MMVIDNQPTHTDPTSSVVDKVKQMVGVNTSEPTPTETAMQDRPILKFRRVHIIVNPASGQDGLKLPALNKLLKDLEIEWEMFVTSRGGEAGERAKQAIAAGVDAIVVYGGDGTVLEVASSMAGSDIPLIIIPGGTANVLSVELGIPADQSQAALLLGSVPNAIRTLDMGVLGGGKRDGDDQSDLFFFHLGMGLEGEMHEKADREAKDRSGMFAYVVAALKTLSNPTTSHYHLTLDGEQVEAEGINCMVTNFGSVGVSGITLSHAIDMSDGLLDVIIFQDANLSSLLSAAASAVTSGELAQPLLQWQAREVTIVADPKQTLVVDGELIDVDSITIRVMPKFVRVVVPAQSAS
ncbi:MAG: diacylglycerol kinase family lipid kinase [Anaerolineae bacterium]|nr:diacylglycerol kinase family lipid kinase [Anaerolineae bacterium]